jgi:hypothetical protein
MNAQFKKMMMVAAFAALFVPTTAFAQKSGGGVVGGARLSPGSWGNQRSSGSVSRSYQSYRRTTPAIVRIERAPTAVAQVPTERRSFSYADIEPL